MNNQTLVEITNIRADEPSENSNVVVSLDEFAQRYPLLWQMFSTVVARQETFELKFVADLTEVRIKAIY